MSLAIKLVGHVIKSCEISSDYCCGAIIMTIEIHVVQPELALGPFKDEFYVRIKYLYSGPATHSHQLSFIHSGIKKIKKAQKN